MLSDESAKIRFLEIYEKEARLDIVQLQPILNRIVSGVFKKWIVTDKSIEVDDVIQDVNVTLLKKLKYICSKMVERKQKGERVYKYIATLIKNEAIRILLATGCVNPRIKARRRPKAGTVSISQVDIGFFNHRASYPIEGLVATFKTKCTDTGDADINKVFDFLISKNSKPEYAGLKKHKYYTAVRKMKVIARKVTKELPYE